MSRQEREALKREADMQTKMIGNLVRWLRAALVLSSVGVVLAWWGFTGQGYRTGVGAAGALVTLLCMIAAVVINLGVKNGKRNVDKMLRILYG